MAGLPVFFQKEITKVSTALPLEEETSRHVVQVLRMKPGDRLRLTDGIGHSALAEIELAEKKKCQVRLLEVQQHAARPQALHLAVAFTKNTSRNEWLLEKATESGATSIIPLSTARTEREKFRPDRWQNILVSAMLQSQQYYLPRLQALSSPETIIQQYAATQQKLIAHCIDELPRSPVAQALLPAADTLVLIGPEGDFSPEEVHACMAAGFKGISLCPQRLRTETAAMSVCAYFNLINPS